MIQKKKFSDAIAANISVVGGLIGINAITKAFTYESFNLLKGETKRIKANGLIVLCSTYYNIAPSVGLIDPSRKKIIPFVSSAYNEYLDGTLFDFAFESGYITAMTSKIEGVGGDRVPFLIAYQSLLP